MESFIAVFKVLLQEEVSNVSKKFWAESLHNGYQFMFYILR